MVVPLAAMRLRPLPQDGVDGSLPACIERTPLISTCPQTVAAFDRAREEPAFDFSGDCHGWPAASHSDAGDRPFSSRVEIAHITTLAGLRDNRVECFADLPSGISKVDPESEIAWSNQPAAPVIRFVVGTPLASP